MSNLRINSNTVSALGALQQGQLIKPQGEAKYGLIRGGNSLLVGQDRGFTRSEAHGKPLAGAKSSR